MPDPFRAGAVITDAWTYRGFAAVVLENPHLRCVVLPGHGARITELVHKAAGRDLLYHHPRVDVRPPVFGVNVDDWWTGGIDEVAPTGHPCVVGGEQLPFLGELWSQAWDYRIEDDGPSVVRVHLWVSGVITPLRVDRWMELRRGRTVRPVTPPPDQPVGRSAGPDVGRPPGAGHPARQPDHHPGADRDLLGRSSGAGHGTGHDLRVAASADAGRPPGRPVHGTTARSSIVGA